MPIQGKKKRRGSGRRPAGAPRRRVEPQGLPWYAKRRNQVIAVIAVLVVAAIAFVVVNNSRDADKVLARRQRGVDEFTGQIQVLLQKISPAASEMVVATAEDKNLAADAKRWDRSLRQVQTDLTAAVTTAAPEVDTANRLIFQAVLQYQAAGHTYALVPDAKGDLQAKILERAAAQVAAADGTWQSAVGLLDEIRTELELDPSGLRAPSAVPASGASPPAGATTFPGGG